MTPVWVSGEELIELNRLIVTASEEPHGVLMEEVVHSAAARPYNHWAYRDERDWTTLGVRLLVGVSRSQAFVQGNKRTGYYGMLRFFEYNSLFLDIEDIEDYADMIIAICAREETEERLVAEFQPFLIETA